MSYQHPPPPTHTHTHAHTSASINSTQPDTLSHWLDELPKPNQTPTTHSNSNLDTVCILAQLAQRADHALLSQIAVGKNEFPLQLVLHSREWKQCPWGKHSNSPYRAWSGSFITKCTFSSICCSCGAGGWGGCWGVTITEDRLRLMHGIIIVTEVLQTAASPWSFYARLQCRTVCACMCDDYTLGVM